MDGWSKAKRKKLFSHAQHDRLEEVQALVAELVEASGSVERVVNSVRDIGSGDTLLVRACRGGACHVARWLLENGADPDQMNDKLFKAPLHEAASVGSVEALQLLLDFGASIGLTKYNGWSALSYACQNEQVEVTRILIDNMSKAELASCVLERNKEGSANLYLACRAQNVEIVKLLLSIGADSNGGNNNKRVPAHACAMNGDSVLSAILIASGADFAAARDSSGSTVWHEAARQGHDKYLSEFLASHLKVDSLFLSAPGSRDNALRHPLHVAARYGHLDTVKALTSLVGQDLKSVLNAQDVDGASPLHLAGRFSFLSTILVIILTRQISVAVLHNHANVVDFLANQPGIDFEVETNGGLTPLQLAHDWKRDQCIAILESVRK